MMGCSLNSEGQMSQGETQVCLRLSQHLVAAVQGVQHDVVL